MGATTGKGDGRDRSTGQGRSGGPSGRTVADVRGVILAGVHVYGDGVLESNVPRPLLPVAGRPLIWHILRWMGDGGLSEVTICANGDTAVFSESLGEGASLGISLDYSEDAMPRGPAGCARDAALGGPAEVFVVIDGTVVPRIDLAALLGTHARHDAALTIAVADGGNTHRAFPGSQEPIGIYVFSRGALEAVSAEGYRDIKEQLIPLLHRRGDLIVTHVVPHADAPRVVGVASYLAVNMWAVKHTVHREVMSGAYEQKGEAWTHLTARVDPSVRFVGPSWVGPHCIIESEAIIVGPTTIAGDCRLGHGSVVSRSALGNGCRIGNGAIVDRCVITPEAVVASGDVCRDAVHVTSHRRRGGALGRLISRCWYGSQESQRPGGADAAAVAWGIVKSAGGDRRDGPMIETISTARSRFAHLYRGSEAK